MELTGTFAGLSEDFITGTAKIEFNIRERGRALDALPRIKDKKLRIKVVQFREKRSLNANSYYWQLLSQLADKLRVSKPFLHNQMLRRYGQIQLLDGKPMYLSIKDTEAVRKAIDEAEDYHLKPTAEVRAGKDGDNWRTYLMLKGSHELDTREMAILIDGIVDEAKEQGIQTLTPNEIERLKATWEGR